MSTPPFNFGTTGSSGSSNIFGQSSAPGQNSIPSLSQPAASASTNNSSRPFQLNFGATNNSQPTSGESSTPAATTTTASLFSGLNTTSAGPQKSLFANFGSNSGSSTPAFGTGTGNANSGSNVFGASLGGGASASQAGGSTSLGAGATSTGFKPFGAAATTNIFGQKKPGEDVGTGSNASASGMAETPQPSFGPLWGSSKPSVFGSGLATSAPSGSTTPATTKPAFSFSNSTTPAGLPPVDINAGSKPSGGLFSGFASTTPSTTGNIFAPKAAEPSSTTPAVSQPSPMFTTGATTGAPSLFATASTTATTPSLFSNLKGSAPATSAQSLPAATNTVGPASKPMFSFQPSSTTQPPEKPSTSVAFSNPFAGNTASNSPAPVTTASSTPATAQPTLFAPKPTLSTVTAPSPLFSSATSAAPATTAPTLFPSTAASTTTAAPTLFAPKAPETTTATPPSSSATAAPAMATTTGPIGPGTSTAAPLGASTAGPAPQLSRLKNKTMDEIITRWASDLSKYQKEFQDQATKVASWDRLLVENGDKIQKLYVRTFEAERASAEVERQLELVENQQDELAAWLDRYESEVDDMYTKQVAPGETLQGPDQERERTYKLAEKLMDRLDEMGKDLTNMIQEINNASATLSKTNKPDDPLSQIVRVLNGHLAQLQWIDQNAAALQVKVSAAQNAALSIGANGGADRDPVDEMFRSYLGRK